VGNLTQVVVDEKHRVTLPSRLRRSLGIKSGSTLEVEQVGAKLVISPSVAIKKPTEAIWGLARKVEGGNPKRQAREAIAKRKRLGMPAA
jgi:AbrB family looped-hinge helix DNA binding protein